MEELHRELRTAAVFTVVLDLLLWGVSVLCIGMTLRIPLGLLLGSAGMYTNLLLLRRAVQNAVYHGRKNTLGGYLLRLLIASAVIASALKLPQISAIAAVIPFLYPKLIFCYLSFKA
ncbi:MAG: hypothetical protein K6F80_04350 [Oscillospiraceae bacterium]|nr:hypothetical protein [Oscillospiraceae bacterium]